MLKEVINKKYIYEFDLAACFPSLKIDYVSRTLTLLKTPDNVMRWIEMMNRSTPSLTDKDLANERDVRWRHMMERLYPRAVANFNRSRKG